MVGAVGLLWCLDRIDPVAETQAYIAKIIACKGKHLDANGKALLQDDLRRAHIEPWAWVVNKSLAATGTVDPLLQARLVGEQQQTERIAQGLAQRTYALPWLAESPVGVTALGALTEV